MNPRNAAMAVVLVVLLGALGVVAYTKFLPGRLPATVEVRNTGSVELVVVLTPPASVPVRCAVPPGRSCAAAFAPGTVLAAWMGPADVGDPATWRIDSLAGPIEVRAVDGIMEIAGNGLMATPVEAIPPKP